MKTIAYIRQILTGTRMYPLARNAYLLYNAMYSYTIMSLFVIRISLKSAFKGSLLTSFMLIILLPYIVSRLLRCAYKTKELSKKLDAFIYTMY